MDAANISFVSLEVEVTFQPPPPPRDRRAAAEQFVGSFGPYQERRENGKEILVVDRLKHRVSGY